MKSVVLATLCVVAIGVVAGSEEAVTESNAEFEENLNEEDIAFFSEDESMTPRLLKRRPFRSKRRPICKAVVASDGRNRCKDVGGRCVASASTCKRLTRGKGFYVRSLCQDANPNTKEKEYCGCCIKRPRKVDDFLGDGDLEVKFVSGAKFGDSERISLAGSQSKSGLVMKRVSLITSTADWGALGFTMTPGTNVKVKPSTKGIYDIEVDGQASSAALDGVPGFEPEVFSGKDESHFYTVPKTVPAQLRLKIKSSEIKDIVAGWYSTAASKLKNSIDEKDFDIPSSKFEVLSHTLELLPNDSQLKLGINRVEHKIDPYELSVQYAWAPSDQLLVRLNERNEITHWPPLLLKESHRGLCVQPVRVRHRKCDHTPLFGFLCFSYTYSYSGAGLDFGRPGADRQWDKVDITFDWQPWKTIIDNTGKYEEVTRAEMEDFKNEVADDPECIEVFFAPKFDPSSTFGGGACWDSGTANAQIISSDEQVPCGVDRTHLAHELGHALGLLHPGDGHPVYADGSTGSLMCGSGWKRDNPRRNSKDNGENSVNPLLSNYLDTFNFFSRPECTDNGDCGTCAEHIPADAC